jgi:hypothetical protein
MEVEVGQVSKKYVSESLIRELFSIVGHVAGIRQTVDSSTGTSTGTTYIVSFMNPSEALKAACLDKVDFGDQKLAVRVLTDHHQQQQQAQQRIKIVKGDDLMKWCKTVYISNIDNDDIIRDLNGVLHTVAVTISKDCLKAWLVEFGTRAQAMESLIRLRTRRISEVKRYGAMVAEEAARVWYDFEPLPGAIEQRRDGDAERGREVAATRDMSSARRDDRDSSRYSSYRPSEGRRDRDYRSGRRERSRTRRYSRSRSRSPHSPHYSSRRRYH